MNVIRRFLPILEHLGPRNSTRIAVVGEETSLNRAIRVLEGIRERADYALKQLAVTEKGLSLRWRCKSCRWEKKFTQPVPLESAGRCPRCKSVEFERVA